MLSKASGALAYGNHTKLLLSCCMEPTLTNHTTNWRENGQTLCHPRDRPDKTMTPNRLNSFVHGSLLRLGKLELGLEKDCGLRYSAKGFKRCVCYGNQCRDRMGQEISAITDHIPNVNLTPQINLVLLQLQKIKSTKLKTDNFDLVNELDEWNEDDVDGECLDECRVGSYCHYRTRLGSPSVNRRSFTEEEIMRFMCENDGFPLPCTDSELKEFDKEVFRHSTLGTSGTKKTRRKHDRNRSKSATSVPDLNTVKLKLQKLQSPGKPKFLEHLINRVVSRKAGKQVDNGLSQSLSDSQNLGDIHEPLSPDTAQCLEAAETLVEELLLSAKRPPSGESSDSGKGSLLESTSTSDFSPTPKRQSWSTPTSPTFHGIVKQRLRRFQTLQETSDTESTHSAGSTDATTPIQKTFPDEEYESEITNVKKFYCALSQDESLNSSIMSSGYVKTLVQRINTNKLTDKENQEYNQNESGDGVDSNGFPFGAALKSVSKDDDSGWDDWTKENESPDGADGVGVPGDSVNGDITAVDENNDAALSARNSRISTASSSSRTNSLNSSRANSVSDNEGHEEEEDEQPKDKLHQIAYELLKTERAYVSRLHLLDQVFHFRVVMENKNNNILPAEVVTHMFSNIKPIYTFHKDFLLPQLEARMKNWSAEQKIGDVMGKFAPFLKIYTEYVKNFDNSMTLIDKWTSQCPKFAALLQEIQKSPECGQLTLQHHMLEPIQRVPRYALLLKDYLKHLEPDAPDRVDGQKALDLVITAASHSNTAMQKIEKFNKLLTIIQRLNGEDIEDLVSPTRELMKEGVITKISARSGEKQARYIFLFNDLLLVCSDKIMGSYKVRARLKVDGMEILPGENRQIANTFCVKCTEKNVEFLDEANNGEGLDWLAMFEQVISDYQQKTRLNRVKSDPGDTEDPELSNLSLGKKAPIWDRDEEVTMCKGCQEKFNAMKRRHHCRSCGKIFCHKCSSKKIKLEYDPTQINRVCQKCYEILQKGEEPTDEDPASPTSPKPVPHVKQVEADKAALLSGYVNVMDKGRTWTKRWITVHADFVLYFYKKNKDPAALQTMPLPGHTVKVHGDSADRPNVFSLMHKNINVCSFQAENDDQFNRWVCVLEKMVKLELPSEEDKRLSTHSSESNQSNSSGQS